MDKKVIAAIILAMIVAGGAVFYSAKAYSGNWAMMGDYRNDFRMMSGKKSGCGCGNCSMTKTGCQGQGQCGEFRDANGNGVCDCRE
jgi:hypothetical protein